MRVADQRFIANTDGADTIRSSNISFNNWTVYNGDDSISLKGNSTDISITNSNFYNGLGIAIGSIGQYNGMYEVIQGLTVENITYGNTAHAVRIDSPKGFHRFCALLTNTKSFTSRRGPAHKQDIHRTEGAAGSQVRLSVILPSGSLVPLPVLR